MTRTSSAIGVIDQSGKAGAALLDHHEQRRGPRPEVVADLLLEGLVDPLLAEVAISARIPAPSASPANGMKCVSGSVR